MQHFDLKKVRKHMDWWLFVLRTEISSIPQSSRASFGKSPRLIYLSIQFLLPKINKIRCIACNFSQLIFFYDLLKLQIGRKGIRIFLSGLKSFYVLSLKTVTSCSHLTIHVLRWICHNLKGHKVCERHESAQMV